MRRFYDRTETGYRCIACGCVLWYSERFDAYYCPWCIEWKEHVCTDMTCSICCDRPHRPFPDSDDATRSP